MKVPFIDLTSQLNEQIFAACNRVVQSGHYIGGDEVKKFEQEWAEYCGTKYCVSCGNGFDAIQLVLRALVPVGSSVQVTPYTCLPTWLAIWVGRCIPTIKKERIGIEVHLYGIPLKLYGEYDLYIEDAAQAHGMEYRGKKAPLFGIAATWSFYPTKNLGALGDAGAITTNDEALAKELVDLRNYRTIDSITSRMDSLQAAILSEKLEYLNEWNDARRRVAKYYLDNLEDVRFPIIPEGANPCWYQFVIRHSERDKLRLHLWSKGIETMIHYSKPPYKLWGYEIPEVEAWCNETLSLPIGIHLSDEQVEHVVEAVNEYSGAHSGSR